MHWTVHVYNQCSAWIFFPVSIPQKGRWTVGIDGASRDSNRTDPKVSETCTRPPVWTARLRELVKESSVLLTGQLQRAYGVGEIDWACSGHVSFMGGVHREFPVAQILLCTGEHNIPEHIVNYSCFCFFPFFLSIVFFLLFFAYFLLSVSFFLPSFFYPSLCMWTQSVALPADALYCRIGLLVNISVVQRICCVCI